MHRTSVLCTHRDVCKFKTTEFCAIEEVCKHYSTGIDKPQYAPRGPSVPGLVRSKRKYTKRDDREVGPVKPKRKYTKRATRRQDYSHLTTSNADIKKARDVLKDRIRYGKGLTHNQQESLAITANIPVTNLTSPERQQILDILKDSAETTPLET